MVETRRSSSSSKRPLASPPPTSSKRSKASESASSSTNGAAVSGPVNEISGPGKESGLDSRVTEPRSSDLLVPDAAQAVDASLLDKPVPADVENGEADVDTDKVETGDGRDKEKPILPATMPWGKLISQHSQNPHLVMCCTPFTVGQSRQCNLCLKDHNISTVLCKVKHMERDDTSIALLEIVGGKGSVQVNGRTYRKKGSLILNAGDELIFSSTGNHAYIFQQLINDNLAAPDMHSSLSILEAQTAPIKGIIEARPGEPSAVAGAATILASLSTKESSELSTLPSGCEVSDDCVPEVDMKDSDSNTDPATASSREKTVAPKPDAANENPNLDRLGLDDSMDADNTKIPGAGYPLRPLLRILAGTSSPDFDFSGSIAKILDEQREIREMLKEFEPPTSLISTKRQAFRDSLQDSILNPDNIDISFENFPYYLSDTTKNVLIASTYVHLKCSKFAKYGSDLPTMSPRILLSGPAGSEIYQETLVKALAKNYGARLLIVDSLLWPGGSTSKNVDAVKETSRAEKVSVYAKRAVQAAALQQKRPTSSVEADITGGSSLSSQGLPKQEISTATSKNYTFKKGDRVKFVGAASPSGFSSLQPAFRGPAIGFRGKVVLAFEKNGSSKIGVRFDRSIPGGNDLGGLCEEDHGFFCAASSLRLESSGGEDVVKLAVGELFEVALNECKSGPLILFVKDIEKSVAGNTDVYTSLKSKVENLPANVVVIGSYPDG